MQGCESCISNLSTKPFINCLLLPGGFDSEGTARLVVASLKKTLGMTEEDLQEKLESFSSDGVYMSKKHRARGGGFLSLHTHLEKLLDIAPDTILYLYTRSKMHQCISGKCTKCITMHHITTGYLNSVKFSKRMLDGSAVFRV